MLNDAGYEPSNVGKPLLDQILDAATHRLVLLTLQPGGGYGYDVRSLQEPMAAYALTTGTLDQALPRLRRIGASRHWRNTLLFAAGRYFSEPQPHQKKAVTDLVMTLDENAPGRLGAVFPVGPNVAIEVVDDGMASEPKYLHPLVTHALRAIHEPEGFRPEIYARMLMSAAAGSDAVRGLIADGLREALSGTLVSRMNAEDVQHSITDIGGELGTNLVLGLAAVKRYHSRSLPNDPEPDWEAFWEIIHAYAEPATAEVLDTVGDLLRRVATEGLTHDWVPADLWTYLSNPVVAFVIQEALTHVADGSPLLVALLRHDVLPMLWKQPVDLTDAAF